MQSTGEQNLLMQRTQSLIEPKKQTGLEPYNRSKIEQLQLKILEKQNNLRRLEAQRNEMNALVKNLKDELHLLLRPSSQIGEVCKMMGKNKCLVKVSGSEKYIVDVDRKIDTKELQANVRVALKDTSMLLHKILPSKIDPLVSLMKVEKVPDSTYDMIGGLDQ